MTISTTRNRRKLAGLVVLPVLALVLAACAPKPPPPPPPPITVSCTTGGTLSQAVEACHLKYRAYNVDTASNGAEATVSRILSTITQAQCSGGALGSYHTAGGTLMSYYPGATSASENLYCMYYSTGACPSSTLGATKAMNGWLASPGHFANMKAAASTSVNAAAGCVPTSSGGRGVYVAVAQFHN